MWGNQDGYSWQFCECAFVTGFCRHELLLSVLSYASGHKSSVLHLNSFKISILKFDLSNSSVSRATETGNYY